MFPQFLRQAFPRAVQLKKSNYVSKISTSIFSKSSWSADEVQSKVRNQKDKKCISFENIQCYILKRTASFGPSCYLIYLQENPDCRRQYSKDSFFIGGNMGSVGDKERHRKGRQVVEIMESVRDNRGQGRGSQ